MILENTRFQRRILIGMWFVLFLPYVLLAFSRHVPVSGAQCLILALPLGLLLLTIASNVPENWGFPQRILLGLWLALFLRTGFDDLLLYDYAISDWPWLGYCIYALIIGVPLLAIASRAVASIGAVGLTVCAGFSIILVYDALALLYGYNWFGVYVRLGIGMWGSPDGVNWAETLVEWLAYAVWTGFRLITYTGLGYLLARRKGFVPGIATSVLIATTDCVLGWLVFLPHDGDFEAQPLWAVFVTSWPDLLRGILAQVSILTVFILAGALITRVRLPQHSRRRFVRFVPATGARNRPAPDNTR